MDNAIFYKPIIKTIPYTGNKSWLCRSEIIKNMPDYDIAVDLFGGSGSFIVNLQKKGNRLYILNDADPTVYNILFNIKNYPIPISRRYTREEYKYCRQKMIDDAKADPQTVNSVYLSVIYNSFFANFYKGGYGPNYRNVNVNYLTTLKNELNKIELTNADYKEFFIKIEKSNLTHFLFIDPPYDNSKNLYFNDFNVDEFLSELDVLTNNFYFILTLNYSNRFVAWAEKNNLFIKIVERPNSVKNHKQSLINLHQSKREEIIIANFNFN